MFRIEGTATTNVKSTSHLLLSERESARMKMLRAVLVLEVVACFSPLHRPLTMRTTQVFSTSYDEAVSAAEAASKEFGPSSDEAKAAWETVEDMNDNTDQAAAGTVDPEKVAAKLAELEELVSSSKPALESFKVELSKIAGAPLFDTSPSVSDSSPDVSELTKAAEAASKEFGADSQEAKMAWEAVEEMNDSNNPSIASIPGLDDECLTETIEKCLAFEEAMASLQTSISNLNK